MASGSTVSASGDIAVLEFLVIAEGDASSILDIETAQLNEGAIGVTLVDGSFSVFFRVGAVRSWGNDSPPRRTADTQRTDPEDELIWILGPMPDGLLDREHTIRIEKTDVTGDALRAYDASLILATLSGPKSCQVLPR